MIGASISRWTMSYFATALAWLFVALALMIAGVAWAAAFLGFALAYAPLLCSARRFQKA